MLLPETLRARSVLARFCGISWLMVISPTALCDDGIADIIDQYFASLNGEVSVYLDSHLKDADNGSPDERANLWFEASFQNYVYLTDEILFETDLRVNLSLPNIQSGNFARPGAIDPEIPFFDVHKAFIKWQGESTDITIGIDRLTLGFAEIYSPVDRYASYHFGKPQHYRSRGDVMINVSRYLGDDTLSFTAFPYHQDSIDPGRDSRWVNSQGDRDFFDETGSGDEQRPSSSASDWRYLLRYEGVRAGYDFYAAISTGPSEYPVIRATVPFPLETAKQYPLSSSAMLGIDAVRGSWNFYADILYQSSNGDIDDTFTRYAIGLSYRESRFANWLGLIEITPTFTYSGEHIHQESEDPGILITSRLSRPHPDSLLTRIEFKLTDEVTAYVNWSRNFSDRDESYGGGVDYAPSDNMRIFFQGLFLSGDPGTQFGRWRNNDFVSLGFSYLY